MRSSPSEVEYRRQPAWSSCGSPAISALACGKRPKRCSRVSSVVVAPLAFTADHAQIAIEAEPRYGSGNGNGGPLNLLDLMVYAVAKERGEPLLCTGKDFAATDVILHEASRSW